VLGLLALVGGLVLSAVPTSAAQGPGAEEARTVRSVVRDPDGTRHIRYERTLMGRPLIGGDFIERRSPLGRLVSVSSSRPVTVTFRSRVATLTEGAAVEAALASSAVARADVRVESVEPVWVNQPDGVVPAFDVRLEGADAYGTPVRLNVYVDGVSGEIAAIDSDVASGTGSGWHSGSVSIPTVWSGSAFLLRDSVGNEVYDARGGRDAGGAGPMSDADDAWGDGTNQDTAAGRQSAGVDVLYTARSAYDYFGNVHGRWGIRNDGRGLKALVHVGDGWPNASWDEDSQLMLFGDGTGSANPMTPIDIVAHEMGHALTKAPDAARLQYSGESGGLNEATSDIFGTAVEFYANSATDAPDYLIGEKTEYGADGKVALRFMDRPSRDGRSLDCWTSSLASMDPHYSSGPLNHWFYLVAEGSGTKTINGVQYNSPTCDGSRVVGVGRRAAERIWLRALTTGLTANSDYRDARNRAIQSAIDLFGIGSTECHAVERAMNAIGAPAGSVTCVKVGEGSIFVSQFVAAYSADLGWPVNAVHSWGPGCIQDFRGGALGDAALMQPNCFGTVYAVTGAHWRRVAAIGSPTIGYPTNNSHRYGSSWTQDFDGGSWRWNLLVIPDVANNSAFVVRTGFRDMWINAGGATGSWGVPTSDEYSVPVGARQNFTGGVKTWRAYPDRLFEGQSLGVDGRLFSADERFMLILQGDGNLVFYGPTGALWASNTVGVAGPRVVLGGDGNLVLLDSLNRVRWSTGTFTFKGSQLVVQNDSNLVLVERAGVATWSRLTGRLRVDPSGPIAIRSTLTGRNWAAELGFSGGWYGAIRAQRTSVGSWERFQLVGDCRSSQGCAILNLANGRYLSAELNYTGTGDRMVRARATSIGLWERFQLVGDCTSVGGCGVRSVANGRFLSADYYFSDPNYYEYGLVRARATAISGWESFRIYEV
jgi:Zn-dependent metalloprotease